MIIIIMLPNQAIASTPSDTYMMNVPMIVCLLIESHYPAIAVGNCRLRLHFLAATFT
jgi:hypothetical protein